MATSTVERETRQRSHWAWYMYDFGNSAYAAVILLAVYSAYFKSSVVGGAEGSRLWGFSLGIAMLVVAAISPILGTIADFTAAKKRILLVFTALSWIFTALLFFVEKHAPYRRVAATRKARSLFGRPRYPRDSQGHRSVSWAHKVEG